MAEITYKNKRVPLHITTGVLFRFESSGYCLDDFADPNRGIAAQVHLLRAALDPTATPETVADNLPPLTECNEAVSAAMAEAMPDDPDEADVDPDAETETEAPRKNASKKPPTPTPTSGKITEHSPASS